MLYIDQITSPSDLSSVGDEQLFTELTPEEGATISGGLLYTLNNQSNAIFTYSFDQREPNSLLPWQSIPIQSNLSQARLDYDRSTEPNYQPAQQVLTPGVTTITLSGSEFILRQ